MGYIDFFHFCFWGTHDAASSIKLLRFNLLPILLFTLFLVARRSKPQFQWMIS